MVVVVVAMLVVVAAAAAAGGVAEVVLVIVVMIVAVALVLSIEAYSMCSSIDYCYTANHPPNASACSPQHP